MTNKKKGVSSRSRAKTLPEQYLRDQMAGLPIAPSQIRAERKKAGLTQVQMAAALRISTRSYEEFESGRAEMHPNHFFVMRCVAQVHTPPAEKPRRKAK